jgi:phosphoribosyl 1,2-cyclic phosphodiesterase
MNLDLFVIESSSKGNCYLITTSREILILECGVRYKNILNGLSFKLDNVAGCLITHEHKDHSKAVNDLMKAGINVYASAGTFEALEVVNHRAITVKSLCQFTIGRFTVLPFDTQHDAKEPLGYLIQHPDFGKLLFATDTFYIKYKFQGLNHIMVECNYSKEILDRNVQSGIVNRSLKNRVLKSHFSLQNVKEFLKANDLSQLKSIYLMHLSNDNSDADYFKSEIEKLTGLPVVIC